MEYDEVVIIVFWPDFEWFWLFRKLQSMYLFIHFITESCTVDKYGRKNSGHLNRDISRRSLKQMQIPPHGGELRKKLLTDNSTALTWGAFIKCFVQVCKYIFTYGNFSYKKISMSNVIFLTTQCIKFTNPYFNDNQSGSTVLNCGLIFMHWHSKKYDFKFVPLFDQTK